MDTIDVRDLPEPMARAVAETVQNLREQLSQRKVLHGVEVPAWPLGVIGRLTRGEIYDYLDDRF